MAKIEIRNLSKTYENKKRFRRQTSPVFALNNVSFTIPDGSFFVLMGESGSGKTTLMRILLGLDGYDDGEVLFDGMEASSLTMGEKSVAFVPQNCVLYPNLTVYENIAMPLRIKKLPYDELLKKIQDAAALFGITDFLTRKPRELSGGQKQRVVLARALVKEANVTFFDEPLSNIEPALRSAFIADFLKMEAERNATYIYSTHRLEEALALADNMAILEKGEVLQSGTPQSLFAQPKNEAVFSFMNPEGTHFFRLPLKGGKLTLGGVSFVFPCPDGLYDFGFCTADVKEKQGGFAADITKIEYLGGQQKAFFNVHGTSLQGSYFSSKIRQVGEPVELAIKENALSVFDAKTKATIFAAPNGGISLCSK